MVSRSLDLLVRRHTAAQPLTYAQLVADQKAIAERVRGGGEGCVFLSELAPTVTLGRRLTEPALRAQHVLWSDAQFASAGIAVVPTERGGFATFHGPGQWVLFVVESLERLTGDRKGVRAAVDGLLEGSREFAEANSVAAHTCLGGKLGVWTERGKVAALGIAVERGVLQHGIAMNLFLDGAGFSGISPCGLGEQPASLLDRAPSEAEFQTLGVAWAVSVARQWGLSLKSPST